MTVVTLKTEEPTWVKVECILEEKHVGYVLRKLGEMNVQYSVTRLETASFPR
jgi:hypothetical protein